jgi:regulator of cell morphogenesis and NO signaling
MAIKLWCHMLKEEQCLFPRIRQIEANDQPPFDHCENLSIPIRQMEVEHDDAGSALNKLKELTDGFSPPEWACKKYHSLLARFAYLERDMQIHIDKEDNLLFPSALNLETRRQVCPSA